MAEEILRIEDLSITYQSRHHRVHAVNNANMNITKGDCYGLVGESGCGKSTIAKSIMGGIDENGEIESGKIIYKGEEIQDYSEKQFREQIRWKEISMIPQSPMTSLNPIERLSDQAWEIGKAHTDWDKKYTHQKFKDSFDIVGLPMERIHDYPFEFSGGMQQRVLIALSIFLEPSLVIADEPTTALDVILQDQIFQHLEKIREERDLSILMITHDISIVFENSQSVGVMHGGQIVETGDPSTIYHDARHPYSILLQRSFPDIQNTNKELVTIGGVPPKLETQVNECTFVNRCPWAINGCENGAPKLKQSGDVNSHKVACIRKDEIPKLKEEYLKEIDNK
ncbi:ABC transporter ATP-binding protein [Natronorarus salvus]|uniref:ABC transporter ATP-binding protein n=1 Tax=Natronorarus salvus TaxID=3117733 RepID=UPI002F26082B